MELGTYFCIGINAGESLIMYLTEQKSSNYTFEIPYTHGRRWICVLLSNNNKLYELHSHTIQNNKHCRR